MGVDHVSEEKLVSNTTRSVSGPLPNSCLPLCNLYRMPIYQVDDLESASLRLQVGNSPLIVVPVFNGFHFLKKCLRSIVDHTPSFTDVLIVDDGSDDAEAVREIVSELPHHHLFILILRKDKNQGYVAACNDAFTIAARRDVILLNSDCIVGPEWYSRLVEAARSSSQIATVSTLTNNGTILSIPNRNRPTRLTAESFSINDVAEKIARCSLRRIPMIPVAVGHCLYIRRIAIDLVGEFDSIFGMGYGEEVDFSLRCAEIGLQNVCADDVFVYHLGNGSFGEAAKHLQSKNDSKIREKYPYYEQLLRDFAWNRHSSLASALDVARVAINGLRVGVDARKLTNVSNGSQVVIAKTLTALANFDPGKRVTAYISEHLDPEILNSFSLTPNIDLKFASEALFAVPEVDVVFRPCQVDTFEDLKWLHSVGNRVVINQLDTIAYSNAAYFESYAEWKYYKDLTRVALYTADVVTAGSQFSKDEIVKNELVLDNTRVRVLPLGTQTETSDEVSKPEVHSKIDLESKPFLLHIGTSYLHKNRDFCLRILEELVTNGWDGYLVFVGAKPPFGDSSLSELQKLLRTDGNDSRIIDLGSISEVSKTWLLKNAALCLYPSVVEGFGLVPFEAARHGLPVISASLGSLREILKEQAQLKDFDVKAIANLVMHLMTCEECKNSNISQINAIAEDLTWRNFADNLQMTLEDAIRQPRNSLSESLLEGSKSTLMISFRGISPQGRIEKTIEFFNSHSMLKRHFSPDGSRRQYLIRKGVNRLRRHSMSIN